MSVAIQRNSGQKSVALVGGHWRGSPHGNGVPLGPTNYTALFGFAEQFTEYLAFGRRKSPGERRFRDIELFDES